MITLKKSLEHMKWSNEKFFNLISELPNEIYDLKNGPDEWNIGRVLGHFIESGEWFRYCLTGEKWNEVPDISNVEKLVAARDKLKVIDNGLVAQSELSDEILEIIGEHGVFKAHRSTILSQAVSHSAEHKGEIAATLKSHSYHLNLEKLDVWTFVGE